MGKNNYAKLVKILSLFVILVSVLVILGWILDIGVLKSIHPAWVTMKFSTALSFLLSGIILHVIAVSFERRVLSGPLILMSASVIILFFMLTQLVSVFVGVNTGVEQLFVKEVAGATKTTLPGRPSLGTMLEFILIATTTLIVLFKQTNLNSIFNLFGYVIGTIGFIAILGYVLNAPLLYYAVKEISTAMALHTTILFTIIGTSFVLLGKNKK